MEMGLFSSGSGKGGSVTRNTEKEYDKAVKSGELKGDDKAAMRAILDRMAARDAARGRGRGR